MSDIYKASNLKKYESFLLDFEKVKNTIYKERKKYEKPPANLSLLKKHSSYPSSSPKQAVVKLLSNLNSIGIKNALNYTINNSLENYAINQYGEKVTMSEIYNDWKQDFSNKKNAKEAWHLSFSINESFSNKSLYALEQSVKNVLEKNFYNHKYAYVLHIHQNKPHIHVLINKNDMFSHKKLHFDSKEEIKDFFNTLREDFKDGLNYYGLNYTNAYKSEKSNFLEQNINSFKYKDSNQINIITNLEKSIDRIYKKIQNFENKLPKKNVNIDKLYEIKNEIIKNLNALPSELPLKQEYTTKQEMKEYYAKRKAMRNKIFNDRISMLKEIKNINIAIKKLMNKDKKKRFFYKKEIEKLRNIAKSLESKMQNTRDSFVRNQQDFFIDLRQKQSYLDYMQNYKKYSSTQDIMTMKNIQAQLRKNSKNILENITNFIELDKKTLDSIIEYHNTHKDSITATSIQKFLGTKLSAKSLIDSKKNIDKFYNILKTTDRYMLTKFDKITPQSYEYYYNLMRENSIALSKILDLKMQNLNEIFTNENELKQYDMNTLKQFQKELYYLKKYIESSENLKHNTQYLNDFENKQKLTNLNNLLEVVRKNILESNAKMKENAKKLALKSKQDSKNISQNVPQKTQNIPQNLKDSKSTILDSNKTHNEISKSTSQDSKKDNKGLIR